MKYTNVQLDAVIEVLESFDIEGWNADLSEYGFCNAPWHVTTLLNRAKVVREARMKK